MMDLYMSGRRLLPGSTVNNGNISGTQPECCSCRIHSNIPCTKNRYIFTWDDRCIIIGEVKCFHQVCTGEILIGGKDTVEVFSRNIEKCRKSCSDTNEYRIVSHLVKQFIHIDSSADNCVADDFDAECFKLFYLIIDNIFGESELGNTVKKYTACPVQCFVDRHFMTFYSKVTRYRNTCRSASDNSYFFTGSGCHLYLVFNTVFACPVRDEHFKVANANRLAVFFLSDDTDGFTLYLLRADTAADSRQSCSFPYFVNRIVEIAFDDHFKKCRYVNAYWASFDAGRILALDTPGCFVLGICKGVSQCDFTEIFIAYRRCLFRHLLSWDSPSLFFGQIFRFLFSIHGYSPRLHAQFAFSSSSRYA